MTRIALGISYNGHAYHGWQSQPHGVTIQDVVQAALSQFLNEPTRVVCAGRTDAGVHALQQVIHCDTTAQRSSYSWVRGLNAILPADVRVLWTKEVDAAFDARFSARWRTYYYLLRNHALPSPFHSAQMGWVFRPLAVDAMQRAADYLTGEHDFSSFRSSECQARSPVRQMAAVRIYGQQPYLLFEFTANGFLQHMIRNIMGVLIDVGVGRQSPEWVRTLLQQRDRRQASPTFTGAGLYLAALDYDGRYELPLLPAMHAWHELTGRLGSLGTTPAVYPHGIR